MVGQGVLRNPAISMIARGLSTNEPGTRYQRYTLPYIIRGIHMRVVSLGRFPGAWRRGSWHFQVASLHLQPSMWIFSLSASHYFFLPEHA